MARRKKEEPPPAGPRRRTPSERKPLPEDLEAFASGDDDALWRRPQRARLRDPRPVYLIPGVANRDARAVYEARLRRIEQAREADDEVALGLELADARQLGIWRAYNIMGWPAFVENVLALDPEEADRLERAGRARLGGQGPVDDERIAIAVRAEAGLLESEDDQARVRLKGPRGEEVLVLEIAAADAAEGLAAAGRRASPIAKERAEAPGEVIDRPRGVPRLTKLIEMDRPKED